jgi:hypothetical protein
MSHLAMWDALGDGQQGPETAWADHLIEAEYLKK